MTVDWPRIKAAVAKVVAGNGEQRVTGTAFFIGGSYALTALHVVADTESDAPRFLTPITLTFEGGITTGAIVSNGLWDVNADWAVLECASPPMVTPLDMRADAPQDADWKAFGYPASESAGEVREGETVAGAVRDERKTLAGARAIQLFCEEAAAGLGARLHGFSGAPCLVDGQVVGLLRSTLIEEVVDGKRVKNLFTKAGTVFACPAGTIVDFQIAKGLSMLQGTWRPPQIVGQDFLLFLSSSEGTYKELEDVAIRAHEKVTDLIGRPHVMPIASVCASRESFLNVVAALCRARVVVLDATAFEPAIMLLAGIRSVVRRGLTILSVGGTYALGDPLSVPFNITDANIVAHSQKQEDRGPDPVDILSRRIRQGLKELESAAYEDNPVYESIRRLPADRRGLIPRHEGVLVLCPFEDEYNDEVWVKRLQRGLKHQWDRLRGNGDPGPDALGVARSFELNSARLVTQALYENIRRAQACIVDLTHWSENVLFELGVRLAASREGTSCLLAKNWTEKVSGTHGQCQQIASLFVDPGGMYDPKAAWTKEAVYAKAYGLDAVLSSRGLADGTVHRTIAATLDVDHEPASRTVYADLIDAAAFFGKIPGGNAKPVGLYPGNLSLTAREDSAEFDRLLTAWFYLHFLGPDRETADEQTRGTIGHIARTLLERHSERFSATRERASDDLARVLDALKAAHQMLKASTDKPLGALDEVRRIKQTATVFRNLKEYQQAIDAFDTAIKELNQLLAEGVLNERDAFEARAEMADTFGMKGGTYRRWQDMSNNLGLALGQYRKGLEIEREQKQSTYNSSNVITLSIALEKRPLDEKMLQVLDSVVERLEKETRGPRADEFWAWADLAQFYLLRKDRLKASDAYHEALQRGPKAEEVKRHLDLLRDLAEGTLAFDREMSDGITATIGELEQAQPR